MNLDPTSEAIGQLRADIRAVRDEVRAEASDNRTARKEILDAVEEIKSALPPLENRVSLIEASRKNGNGLLLGGAAVSGSAGGVAVTAFWKTIAAKLGLG